VGWGYYQLGGVLMAGGDYADALDSRQKALAIREKFSTADPQNAQASFDLAGAHVDLAEALTANGDPVRAVEEARKGITILTTLLTADPTNVIYSRNLAVYEEKLGDACARSGADKNAPTVERIRAWSDARETYKKAGQIFSNLRDHGTLPPADAALPQKLATRTSDCQQAIKQLTPANNSP
jgi:tetratricopeptide (TPR) repeat protein